MDESPKSRAGIKWALGTLGVLAVLVVILVAVLESFDGNRLRDPLVRYLNNHSGREIQIDGPVETHLLSWHPSVRIERVTIGNPPWTPPGHLAELEKVTAVFDLSLFHRTKLHSLELHGVSLHLWRDSEGHANWHWHAPGILPGKGLPVINDLSAPEAQVDLHDDRRHLEFKGTLTMRNTSSREPLQLAAKGLLNGRDVTLSLDGEPLATAAPDQPFHFTFDARSSGSHLTGRATLPRPFNFALLDGEFQASGADLKDLYFLAGVHLPDSGAYQLSGKLHRADRLFKLFDLNVTSGKSDARCTIDSVLDEEGRARVAMDIDSDTLRLADLGARAAGRAPQTTPGDPKTPPQLPDTPLHLDSLRRTDYTVNFHAKHLETEKLTFGGVIGKITVDHGMVTVPQLSGAFEDGKVSAHMQLEAQTDTPKADLDLTLTNIALGQLPRKDPSQPAALDGRLQGRVTLTGHGHSIRSLVASTNGTVTASIPEGAIRASFAEIAGVDFRGLGLMLTKNKKDTAIRCGVANFQAHEGVLTAQTLILDTDPVLITGGGTIDLASETLDLELEGHPKELRVLRISAPISVQGPLLHPSFALEKGQRKFKLIDPGHARDADCGALLSSESRRP
jgi:uncharacterized protein involved in outer membrane biogenesis